MGHKTDRRFTKPKIPSVEVILLLHRLRPLVHVNGSCSCCGHTDAEDAAIGRELRKWWDEQGLDDHRKWPKEETLP